MKDLELLCNSTDFCLTANYCADINDNKKKSACSSIKINMSLDKYFKRKFLEDEELFKTSSHVTQSNSKKSHIKKLYNIC